MTAEDKWETDMGAKSKVTELGTLCTAQQMSSWGNWLE